MKSPLASAAAGALRLAGFCLLLLAACSALGIDIGVARLDVTPREPIRLTGYGGRTTNSLGVAQKLWAKALALGRDREGPAVLLTLDNCGVAEPVYREVVRRLERRTAVRQERFVLACSHTHTGPCTTGWAPNIFSKDIPPEQQAVIDRYTRELVDGLEQVVRAALDDRRPGTLSWSQGRAGFARNRRIVVGNAAQFGDNAAGPVDQSLPILAARGARGELRAVVANYACHCTTLGGEFNQVCGDWAGFAQEALEREHPGSVALITIGCGADANPSPRGGADGGLAFARRNGEELAAEVTRLLGRTTVPLAGRLKAGLKHIELDFGAAFARSDWEARAQRPGIVGYHARRWLERLNRGETPPRTLSYYVQSWSFGDDLALVFLSGEVVVDYALRLKQEFDPSRLWVTAYANYVPCYIPSRRILAEGGYEAEESLWYYDRPGRLSTNIEDHLVRTVHEVVPRSFLAERRKAEFPDPKPPERALATLQTDAGLTVELMASEPLIESPVAIDWGADGRLWVCEMYDYPAGVDGNYRPGGRIKVLSSSRRDGRYDRATLFLDGLAFPTGVMPWGRGALICAAPDILYAEDTDGDGRADVVRTNFTGFATHNFQARVNGFSWGLDGWLHGSSGLFGGKVRSLVDGTRVELSGRDFRLRPDSGRIEPVAGLSQMGRVRDEFDNWYGNDNSTLLWHYPLPERSVRRNPHAIYPEPRVLVASAPDANVLFPASRTLERFNDPQMANRVTSACGPEIYRDVLLGPGSHGDAFICEPVHNLVTRLALRAHGATVTGARTPAEARSEFLASTDNWFRPVQARTGPDGALWVVDMYRFVIEHPRWIPPNRLKELDVRAGAERGRLYRVYARGATLRPVADLTRLSSAALARAMDTPNGPTRDLIQARLTGRRESRGGPAEAAAPADKRPWASRLAALVQRSGSPEVRAQALATLGLAGSLSPECLQAALRDASPGVRRQGLRQLPGVVAAGTARVDWEGWLRPLVDDADPAVRFELALTLGDLPGEPAGSALGRLATESPDPWLQAAVLSSAAGHGGAILRNIGALEQRGPEQLALARQILSSQPGAAAPGTAVFEALCRRRGSEPEVGAWRFGLLSAWLEGRGRGEGGKSDEAEAALALAEAGARRVVQDSAANEADRSAALDYLGRRLASSAGDVELFAEFLKAGTGASLRQAALAALGRRRDADVARALLGGWPERGPAERTAVLGLLVKREGWALELLRAVERGAVGQQEIALADRQLLLKSPNAACRELAARVFGAVASNRQEALARYAGVAALGGAPDQGAQVFEKNCALCHAYRGRGHAVGPNLVEFAGKTVQDFVVAIVDPNAAINPGFLAYTLELKDGRSLTGLVRAETASGLTLAQGGGVQEKILRRDIQEMRASALSLMPEGLEQGIAPQEMADLIAWIKQSAPARFGSATPEQAARARTEFLAGGMNGLNRVVKAVEELPYASWMGRLPLAYCRQNGTTLVWQTEPAQGQGGGPARFRMAAAFGHRSQPQGSFRLSVNGREAFEFDVTLEDSSWHSADGRVRMEYTVVERNTEDSNGVLTIEVPPSWGATGRPNEFAVTGSSSSSLRWFGVYRLEATTAASAAAK